MPRKAKELSAIDMRRLTEKGFYPVGGVAGLALRIKPSGAKTWILRAEVGGKRKDIGLGGFPDVSLAQAREKARETRELIDKGIDPTAERNAAKAALKLAAMSLVTFEQAARRCHGARQAEFRSEKHRFDWINSLEKYAFPLIGSMPVQGVELAHVMRVLEPIWYEKTETATRVRQRMQTVLNWAKVSGLRTGDNPAQWEGHLRELLPAPNKIKKVQHQRALPWQAVPEFMVSLQQRSGMAAQALAFAILTAARSGEVRGATWAEIDLEARLWTIPAERMKAGKAHRVPLSDAVCALLESLPRMGGSDSVVFWSPRGGPLSDVSLSLVTRKMGVDAVPHGFRSSFKDWCRSVALFPDEVSELALAHVSTDATRAAYARDELLPQRAQLMQDWGRFCLEFTNN